MTYSWKERCLDDAEKESHSYQALVVVYTSRGCGYAGPHSYAARKVDGRADAGEDHVGGELGEHVPDV